MISNNVKQPKENKKLVDIESRKNELIKITILR